MTNSEFETMLQRLANFWSRNDYDRVAEHFTDPLFYSDALNYSFYDRSSLLDVFRDDGGHEQECRFPDHMFDAERQTGVAEYTTVGILHITALCGSSLRAVTYPFGVNISIDLKSFTPSFGN